MTASPEVVAMIAASLEAAWLSRNTIEPLTDNYDNLDVSTAYAAQTAWTELREAAGDTIVGRKIGLTSRAVQAQMGVGEPDYGTLWGSRQLDVSDGFASAQMDAFLQPRVEGELAFLLDHPPRGACITPQQVLAATIAIAPAIEIVDSRISGWRIKLPDTVADNASYGGFALGPWSTQLRFADLRTVGMAMTCNGQYAVDGVGAAALGHPAAAVAWLLNKLVELDIPTRRGDIILSGALAATVPAAAGDIFTLQIHGQSPLSLAFH